MMRERAHRWKNSFRRNGFRWTMPRQVILLVLNREKEHPTAEEIYFKAHQLNPGIGLTTVYRTLEILQKVGAVRKYDFGHGKARYELNRVSEMSHHHHLICRGCRKIINYSEMLEEETILMSQLKDKLQKKHSFKIDAHQIHFYGLCSDCQAKA